ncbi:MAG: hypothetical protein ACREOO_13090 [bacterium]
MSGLKCNPKFTSNFPLPLACTDQATAEEALASAGAIIILRDKTARSFDAPIVNASRKLHHKP